MATLQGRITSTTLGSFEIFQKLGSKSREAITQHFRIKQFAKGQYVISESQANSDVYFLISGTVSVCAFAQNGKQVQFEELEPGMMFGELSAIDTKNRSSNCVAVTEAALAVISSEDFQKLIDEYKSVRNFVIQRLAYLVRLHMRKLYELASFPVYQRVRFELLRIASISELSEGADVGFKSIDLSSVPTHAEIAARIGTHREAVTREIKSLERAGVITWRPGEYSIHDVAELMTSDATIRNHT